MNLEQVVKFLESNRGHLKTGKAKLAKRLNTTEDIVAQAFKQIRINNGTQSLLQKKLDEIGESEENVKWSRYWGKDNWTIQFEKTKEVESSLEDILAKFKDVISPVEIKIEDKDNRKALFIYIADKHVGASHSNNSLFQNEYNATIFRDRLLHSLGTITKLFKKHGLFDHLYLIDLGDALDGFNKTTTRGGHELPQNLDNIEQIETFFNVHKEWIDTIVHLNVAKDISYIACCNSNHDGDYGYAAHRLLDVYIECKYPNIHRKLITKFIDNIQYGEHTFILTHGKDKKEMKFGFPLELNAKTKDYIQSYILQSRIFTPNIHVIKGDLHQAAEVLAPTFRYKNVLSLYGASNYVMTNFCTNQSGYYYEVVDKYSKDIEKMDVIFE